MLKPRTDIALGGYRVLKTVIIDNSDALRPFDAVKLRNGDLEAVAAGNAIFGIVIEIVDKNDLPISPTKVSLANVGTATVDTTVTPQAVTVASDNETVDQIACKIDLSLTSIYSGDVEASETPGTTTTSNKPGGWVDLADQRTVDETTHTRTIGTAGQMYGWGTDPLDSTNLLVSIHESEFWGVGLAVT